MLSLLLVAQMDVVFLLFALPFSPQIQRGRLHTEERVDASSRPSLLSKRGGLGKSIA